MTISFIFSWGWHCLELFVDLGAKVGWKTARIKGPVFVLPHRLQLTFTRGEEANTVWPAYISTNRCGLRYLDVRYTVGLSINNPILINAPVLAKRKPMLLLVLYGLLLFTLPTCMLLAVLFQLPPRITRLEPPTIPHLYISCYTIYF